MKTSLSALIVATLLAPAGAAIAQERLPTTRAAVDPAIAFPEIKRATRPRGAFVRPRNVVMVTPGMTKGQLYTLLDVPHFSEGLFGVKRWNYIFNFYTGQNDEYRVCQYQVRFDRDYRVSGTWWRDAACAELVDRLVADPAAVVQTVNTPAPPAIERALKTFEFNFDFDSSQINSEGHSVIGTAIADARAGGYRRIVVTGFTDTKGSVDYNDALGARRAAAVVSELSQRLDGTTLSQNIFSRSGRDLVVETGDEVKEVRNRRVRIEFY